MRECDGSRVPGSFWARCSHLQRTLVLSCVSLAVASAAQVKVSVLDVTGREVAVVAEGAYEPGRYAVTWNGIGGGRPAPAGLYFVRATVAGRTFVSRVVGAR